MHKYPSAKEISISLINNKIIERIDKKKHITDTEIFNYISILHKNEGRDEQLVQIILQIWINLLGHEIKIKDIYNKVKSRKIEKGNNLETRYEQVKCLLAKNKNQEATDTLKQLIDKNQTYYVQASIDIEFTKFKAGIQILYDMLESERQKHRNYINSLANKLNKEYYDVVDKEKMNDDISKEVSPYTKTIDKSGYLELLNKSLDDYKLTDKEWKTKRLVDLRQKHKGHINKLADVLDKKYYDVVDKEKMNDDIAKETSPYINTIDKLGYLELLNKPLDDYKLTDEEWETQRLVGLRQKRVEFKGKQKRKYKVKSIIKTIWNYFVSSVVLSFFVISWSFLFLLLSVLWKYYIL
jgi:hypothetical protein